ncbi:kinase-like domain-containing protein [Desarmillaria tabescens]|uniref:non-specific serine/threonine protein kinase n=1 Tax=Armillaria tabescens TaxID=1929756 RepID=A0AA39JEP2_ARMTA|nr:kinase-like domain-containing protein [Desarmillaria tabescens]KAK0441233.1 kinase-like domain-containing protein [Desarmillaria tabescens]
MSFSQKNRALVSSVPAAHKTANKDDAAVNNEVSTEASPEWTLNEENRCRYKPGGYHPVQVGDNYAGGRYTITGKLGWGEYSTVWLTRDNETNIDVSLKIMIGEATQAPELHELDFFQYLRRQNPGHVGYPHVVHLTDSFHINGPHGKHLCVVTEMALSNLLSLTEQSFAGYRIPEYGAKRVMRDVLSALDYVHNECNIIHTNVKITNVVMTAPLEEMPKEGVGALIPAQQHTFPVCADNDAPVTITKSIQIVPNLDGPEAWDLFSFKLIDFGVACYADKTGEHFTQEVCPVGIRPPEVALRAGWGKSVDIWSAGCMLYGMLVGRPLFPVQCDPIFLPAYQVQALGEFPASLRNRSRLSKAWFSDDGSLRHKELFPKKSLEALMQEQSGAALTLSPDCMDFMRRMLTIEPNERAVIEELLGHRWLNSD